MANEVLYNRGVHDRVPSGGNLVDDILKGMSLSITDLVGTSIWE